MTLTPDHRVTLDRISAALAAEEPHLTGMYRVFGKLTRQDLIPDEDAVRPLLLRAPGAGTGGPSGPLARTGHLARIAALPLLLLGIVITIIAFTAGAGSQCTRATSLHGGLTLTCPAGKAGQTPGPMPGTGR